METPFRPLEVCGVLLAQLTLLSVVQFGQNSNSSKILCMSVQKKVESILTEEKWSYRFFRRSMAANSRFSDGIWLKFELIIVFIDALVTCKNEEDPIKMKALE